VRLVLLTLVLASVGCQVYEVTGYAPISKIVERPSLAVFNVSDSTMSTKGSHIYVGDLAEFLRDTPPGSDEFHGRMIHEQVHATRQFDYLGLPGELALASWLTRYAVDHGFMWQEEQLGYYPQIKYLLSKGRWPRARTLDLAASLSKGVYKTITGKRMVSFEEALKWIESVVSGAWSPVK